MDWETLGYEHNNGNGNGNKQLGTGGVSIEKTFSLISSPDRSFGELETFCTAAYNHCVPFAVGVS